MNSTAGIQGVPNPVMNGTTPVESRAHGSLPLNSSHPLCGYQHTSDEHKDSPWTHKTVLSFDGGGVRGYSSLLIMDTIMSKVKEVELELSGGSVRSSKDYPWMGNGDSASSSEENEHPSGDSDHFLPCHYFDYVTGTSTGGLAAIMLGRLRMGVGEALDTYTEFGNAVFGKPRRWHELSITWYPRAKYASAKTRAAFRKIVVEKGTRGKDVEDTQAQTDEPFRYRDDRTRTIVFSFCIKKRLGISIPYLWRSYDHDGDPAGSTQRWEHFNPGPADETPTWEVARATSAAPRYFESIKIGEWKHLDGGLYNNNPSLSALREICRREVERVPAIFVSIGTGKKAKNQASRPALNLRDYGRSDKIDAVRRKQAFKKYWEIARHATKFMSDTEGEIGWNGWKSHCGALKLQQGFRLNVEGGLVDVPLDDWRPAKSGADTLEVIRQHTQAYLDKDEVQAEIKRIAEILVDIRRRRAATERWEQFATDVTYRCLVEDCPRHHSDYKTRPELRQHIAEDSKHYDNREVAYTDCEDYLNECRRWKQ
ncbi:acyl transferase/acyl hydrolase/lysophospholipase [Xylariales sp. AK1849]|nr:acyl transferase/acyl hydrolase/lysophospholipase [Xylariales sp. AK1849]